MYTYYEEPEGGYMEVDTTTENGGMFDVRASAITVSPSSVQGTLADQGYIDSCRLVTKGEIPFAWARMFAGFSKEELNEAERAQVEA